MIPEVLALSFEDGGNSHAIEIGIILSNVAIIIATICLTIVTAFADNAIVKIARLIPRKRAKDYTPKHERSTSDGGDNGSATPDGASS